MSKSYGWKVRMAAGAALALMLAGCGTTAAQQNASASQKPVYGGTFSIGIPVDAGTLDPRLAQDTSAQAVDSLIFNGLVAINNSLQAVPGLATRWKQVNATTWDFTLRQGVEFSNGQPFTSADVVYTYQTILNPKFNAPHAQLYAPIKSVVALGKYEVQFNLSEPYAPLLSYLNMGIVPHLSAGGANFATHPIGTGPYELKSWQRNSQITLVRNPHFYGQKPYLSQIDFAVLPDNTAQVNALKAGTLNMITSPLPPQDIITLEKDPSVTVQKETGLGIIYLNLNLRDPILKDLKVREALDLLVNRQAITQSIYKGIDTPAATTLIPGTWAYDPNIQAPAFNVAAAKKLLAEDGWTKNSQGVLQKNGKTLTLTLSTYNDPNRVEILTYLQNVLSQVGIQAKVVQQDWATFIAGVMAHHYQVALIGWLGLVDPDKAMYEQFTTNGAFNWEGYSSPTVDQLLQSARTATTIAQRKADYDQASQIVLHDLPYIVLADQGWVVVTGKNVHGLQINRTGSFRNLESVWLSN